jgi:hypothetical protein
MSVDNTDITIRKGTSFVDVKSFDEVTPSTTDIYVDPEKEAAALHRFDKFFLPAAFLFLVLSALDRSNVTSNQILPVSHICKKLTSPYR